MSTWCHLSPSRSSVPRPELIEISGAIQEVCEEAHRDVLRTDSREVSKARTARKGDQPCTGQRVWKLSLECFQTRKKSK